MTHKIDERTDVERDHVVATVARANPRVVLEVIQHFSTGYHARNGGGDSIQTDGSLPILDARTVRATGSLAAITTDSRDSRPAATVVASSLLVLRSVAALTVAAGLAVGTVQVDDRLRFAAMIVSASYGIAVVPLAVGILRGSNSARIIGMVLASTAVATQVVGSQSSALPAEASLPGLAIDVLLLLALSSERALVFARRRGGRAEPQPTSPSPHPSRRG